MTLEILLVRLVSVIFLFLFFIFYSRLNSLVAVFFFSGGYKWIMASPPDQERDRRGKGGGGEIDGEEVRLSPPPGLRVMRLL